MHPLINESFDRFARYQHVESVRAALGAAPLDILDVGDPYGTLDRLFPDDRTVSADVYAEELPPRDRHEHVLASGFELPFPDDSFDLVTCHDTLEHVPLERKTEFIAELLRVSRGPVLVVAPFADPRTSRCEELANAYYVARLGHEMYQLTEHAASGLPALGEVLSWAEEQGLDYQLRSDGWLYHWLSFMILKIHLLSEQEHDAHRRVDAAFNLLLRDADRRRPHYRRAIVLRPPAGLEPVPVEADGDDDAESDLAQAGRSRLRAEHRAAARHQRPRRRTRRCAPGSPLAGTATVRSRSPHRNATRCSTPSRAWRCRPRRRSRSSPSPRRSQRRRCPTVGVVLVNLNGADHLPDCLDSLAGAGLPARAARGRARGQRLHRRLARAAAPSGTRGCGCCRRTPTPASPRRSTPGSAPLDTECVVLLNNDARVEPGVRA